MIVGLFLLAASCKSAKPAESFGGGSEKLYAHQWVLTEVDGQPVTPAETGREAHLLFSLPNRLAGSTGCNRLTGTFTLSDGNKIKFSPLGTTRMSCPNAEAETRFVKAIDSVETYSVTDSDLLLSHDRTIVARFKASPAKADK